MKRRILFSLILGLSYLSLMFNSSEARQHNNENDNVKFQNLKEKVEVCKNVIGFDKKENPYILKSIWILTKHIYFQGMTDGSQSVFRPDAAPNQAEDNDRSKGSNKLLMGIGVGVGAVAGVAAAPFVLSAAGFTAGGVAVGSMAATVQSVFYGGAAAGGFSALQSAGAAGLGLFGNAVAGSIGAGMAAGAAKVVDSVSDESTKNE